MNIVDTAQTVPLINSEVPAKVVDPWDERYANTIRALHKKPMNRSPEENSDLKAVIKTVAFFHNVLTGDEYEFFIRDFTEQISIKSITAGKAVYHKGEFDDHFYLILKGNVVMYREDTGHSIYESEEFKFQEEEEGNPNKIQYHDEHYKAKNNAALRDLDLLMSDKAKHDQGSLEKTGVPDFRQFDPEKFDVGVAKFIYLMSKYDPKKSKVDPYGPEVDDETKFIYDYSLLFYAQIERPDKYYRAGKFHYRPVRRFKRGEYFGEAGMIVSQPRTETAIAADEVVVAYMPRKKALSRFPQIMAVMEFRMKYLIPFFKVINHVYVVKLCAAMREEFYDHGAMIFQQGQKLGGFYIIIEGEVELVKDITVNKYLINNHQSMHSFKTRRYLIDTIKEGQIFGEDDLFFEKNMSYFASVKSKNVHLIRMTSKIFETFFQHYPYIFDELYVMASLRRKNRLGKVSLIEDPTSVAERKKYLYVAALQPGQSKEYIEKIVHMQEEEKKNENPKEKLKIPKPRIKTFFSRVQMPKYIEKMKESVPANGKHKRIIPLVRVVLDHKEKAPEPEFKMELFKRDSVRLSKRSNSDYQRLHSITDSLAPSIQNLDSNSQKADEKVTRHENGSNPIFTDDPNPVSTTRAPKHIEVEGEIKEDEENSDNSIDMEMNDHSNPHIHPEEIPKFESPQFPEGFDSSEFTKNDEEILNDLSKLKINNMLEVLETPERKKIRLPTIVSPIRRIETDPETINSDSSRKYPLHLRLNSLLRNTEVPDDTGELYSTLRKKYDQLVSPKSSRLFQLTSIPNNVSQSYNTDTVLSRIESFHSAAQPSVSLNPMSPLSPKLKPKVKLSSPKSVKRDLEFGSSPRKRMNDLRLTITIQKQKMEEIKKKL